MSVAADRCRDLGEESHDVKRQQETIERSTLASILHKFQNCESVDGGYEREEKRTQK